MTGLRHRCYISSLGLLLPTNNSHPIVLCCSIYIFCPPSCYTVVQGEILISGWLGPSVLSPSDLLFPSSSPSVGFSLVFLRCLPSPPNLDLLSIFLSVCIYERSYFCYIEYTYIYKGERRWWEGECTVTRFASFIATIGHATAAP